MFPLHPETPPEGQSLEALFNTSSLEIKAMVDNLKAKARSMGLPFGDRTMTYNSRLAQELGIWAEECGHGHQFHMAAFESYFVHGKNLAEIPILLELAKIAGLSPEQAEEILHTRKYKEAVDKEWHYCRERKITAVPTFSLGTQVLVGAQSYQTLQNFLLTSEI